MALIKCSECGRDVSSLALACPSCGNPIRNQVPQVDSKPPQTPLIPKWWRRKRFLLDIVLLLGTGVAVAFFIQSNSGYFRPGTATGNLIHEIRDAELGEVFDEIFYVNEMRRYFASETYVQNVATEKIYSVQHNSFWGYEFYTSKIDSSESIDIGSEAKQRIAHLLNSLDFPAALTKKLVIAGLDPTVVRANAALEVPWAKVPMRLSDATVMENNGIFFAHSDGGIIFVNDYVRLDLATLTHELGHLIGTRLTDEEWKEFYKLRNIPSHTPRSGTSWATSPTEDFAEVYKFINRDRVVSKYSSDLPRWDIRTEFGILVNGRYALNSPCASIELKLKKELGSVNQGDPELQNCRRKNNGVDERLGARLFVSGVDDQTKQFIARVLVRLAGAD